MKKYSQEIVYDVNQITDVAQDLFERRNACKVFTFTGPLGAGKTTLVQGLIKLFDIYEPIPSPTFTYVNIYENEVGQKLYHFDLYRLNSLEEFLAMGFDEYLYASSSWSFIEWPELILPLLVKQVCHVTIEYEDIDKRLTKISGDMS